MNDSKPALILTARCILGHVETLSEAQIEDARRDGVAFCSRCGNVTLVAKAEVPPAEVRKLLELGLEEQKPDPIGLAETLEALSR